MVDQESIDENGTIYAMGLNNNNWLVYLFNSKIKGNRQRNKIRTRRIKLCRIS